jgi:hypothetical protein
MTRKQIGFQVVNVMFCNKKGRLLIKRINGAAKKTRTSMGCPTTTSTLRVYQFRHGRTLEILLTYEVLANYQIDFPNARRNSIMPISGWPCPKV